MKNEKHLNLKAEGRDFTNQKFERSPLSAIEKEVVKALDQVTFLPASYDKRFWKSLSVDGHYTWKQKRYIAFIFNKYRKQISNYQDLALRLDPDRMRGGIFLNFLPTKLTMKSALNVALCFKPLVIEIQKCRTIKN